MKNIAVAMSGFQPLARPGGHGGVMGGSAYTLFMARFAVVDQAGEICRV